MPIRQQIFALTVCVLVFIFTIDMVRRRRLREEYSALWLATSLLMFILVIKYDWLEALTHFIGAGLVTTTLFIGSTIFLILIAVQFSFKISTLTNQMKDLTQENALQKDELAQLKLALAELSRTTKGCAPGLSPAAADSSQAAAQKTPAV